MERAISEINDLAARSRRLLGRSDDVRLQARVRTGEGVPRPARVRVARRHPREPRRAQRRLRPLRGAVRRAQLGAADRTASRSSPSTRPSPTSTTARSAAAATRGSRSSSPTTPSCGSSSSTTTCCRCRAPGRERNVVYDAGDALECLQRAGCRSSSRGHKHVPYAWRLENMFIVNAGTVSSLRLRGNTRPCYNVIEVEGAHVVGVAPVPVPRAGADHPVLDRDARVREVHGADRGGALVARLTGPSRVIDGEHYAPVVRDALAELPYEFVAALLVGGTEKLRGGRGLRRAARRDLEDGARARAGVVVDLSDEPVLGPRERLALASRALAAGLPYVGADFRFDPPRSSRSRCPSLAVIGTGKRVGKTAVTGHLARLLAARPRRRRRRDGPRRAGRARAGRGRADASTTCWRSRAPAAMPPRTTSRRRRSPACRRSAAGAAAAGSPARRSPRTCSRAPASPPRCDARRRRLRRQRRRDPADRHRRAILVAHDLDVRV